MEGRTISVYFSPPQYITMSLYHHSTTFLNHSLRLCENIKQELSLKTLEFEVIVLGVTVIYKECLHLGQVGAHLMPHHLEIISINANSLDLSCKMNSQPSKKQANRGSPHKSNFQLTQDCLELATTQNRKRCINYDISSFINQGSGDRMQWVDQPRI